MAATTIAIQGKVLAPDGNAATGGDIVIQHVPYGKGTVEDSGVTQILAPQMVAVIEPDGTVSFNLIPNDVITTPGNSSAWRFLFRSGGEEWAKYVYLESTDPDPSDIGDLDDLFTIGSDPIAVLNSLGDVNVPSPNDNEVLTWNAATSLWEAAAGGGGGGANDLDDLSDVVITTPADGHVLQRDGGSFVNKLFELPLYTTVGSLPSAGSGNIGLMVQLKESGQGTKFIVYGQNGAGTYVRQVFWQIAGSSTV